MAKGLLATQEADQRRLAALRSEQAARAALRSEEASNAEASYREKQALRETAFAEEEIPYATMNFSMGPPQPGLVQTPKNPGLMGGPQYQSSDLPSGMTPEDVQKMFDYQRQAGTQEITAVPYNVGFRPGQQPTLLNQQQMPSAPMPRQLMQSSNAQLIGATPPTLPGNQQISIPGASPRPEFSADMLRGTQPIDSGQGRFNKNIPNQFGRSASPPMSIPRQQPTLSGKTLQPLSDYARLEPEPQEMPDTSGRSIYEPPHGSVSPQPGSRNYGATKRQQEIIHEFIPEDFEQTGERIPRTMRNNNPVALSKTNIDWDGLSTVQDDVQLAAEDFPMAQFDNPIMGARAAARNFLTKFHRGEDTVSKIIQAHLSSVRPLDEHHALVKSVSKHMGVKSSATINLDNEDQLNKFVEGVVAHEGGGWGGSATRHFIDSGIVQTGVTMALDKVKKTATKPAKDLGLPPAK